jgi:hypothetical protein
VVLTISGLILLHDHIEHPMQAVFDAPMAADDGIETFRREGAAEQMRVSTVVLPLSSRLGAIAFECLQTGGGFWVRKALSHSACLSFPWP